MAPLLRAGQPGPLRRRGCITHHVQPIDVPPWGGDFGDWLRRYTLTGRRRIRASVSIPGPTVKVAGVHTAVFPAELFRGTGDYILTHMSASVATADALPVNRDHVSDDAAAFATGRASWAVRSVIGNVDGTVSELIFDPISAVYRTVLGHMALSENVLGYPVLLRQPGLLTGVVTVSEPVDADWGRVTLTIEFYPLDIVAACMLRTV